jgi:2-oxoglutarate ferredoxin oxidoreductase subunit alpha
LARPWAIPGTAGLEHRIGGLEKEDKTGNVSYDAANHQLMTDLRAAKVERVADSIPPLEVYGPSDAKILILGWGSSLGAIKGAANLLQKDGVSVCRAHLRHLNPFPKDLGEIMERFDHVLVPEMNMGQLALLLRAKYLRDVVSLCKVEGKPFFRSEICDKVREILGENNDVN